MTVDASETRPPNEINLELALLQLAHAVIGLGQAVERLAIKEHSDLSRDRRQQEYESIRKLLENVRGDLERVAETVSDV